MVLGDLPPCDAHEILLHCPAVQDVKPRDIHIKGTKGEKNLVMHVHVRKCISVHSQYQ